MYKKSRNLQGSSVKPSQDVPMQNTPSVPSSRKVANSLGITVNTNLGANHGPPPEQIFHIENSKTDQQTNTIRGLPAGSESRRNAPPKPLDLAAIRAADSNRTGLRLRASSQETRTPIIIVTPTQEEREQKRSTPWNQTQAPPVRRPPIASSVYTGAPSAASPSPSFLRHYPSPPSPVINTTPPCHLVRQGTNGSTILSTPHRSTGWWNVITSPFTARFSGAVASRTSDDSSPTEQTPLRERAAPIAEDDLEPSEELENDEGPSPGFGLNCSPFRNYVIPTTGEAAAYYDQSIDFSTPSMVPAGFASPNLPQTARSAGSGSVPFSPDDREVPILLAGEAPQMLDSSKKVPEPQMPTSTPPKSSFAPIVETFDARPPATVNTRSLEMTPPQGAVLSPMSPSPILETAAVRVFQTARSVHASPNPTAVVSASDSSTKTNTAPLQPAFRIMADNDDMSRDLHESPSPSERGTDNNENGGRSPAFRFVPESRSRSPSLTPTPTEEYVRDTPYSCYGHNRISEDPVSRDSDRSDQLPSFPPTSEKEQTSLARDIRQEPYPTHTKMKRNLNCTVGKMFLIGTSILLLIIVVLATVLCMTIAQGHSSVPVESHWLNLTGYPPLPTGISTVSRPRKLQEASDCVDPPEMWSCSLPKGQQNSYHQNQIDFRFAIFFNNQTISNSSSTQPKVNHRSLGSISPTAYAHAVVRRAILRARSALSIGAFTPYPIPPSLDDQTFLGSTTDNVSSPFHGEETPFFISMLPTTIPAEENKSKRFVTVASRSPNLLDDIPAPEVNLNGKPVAAEFHPLPESQPLRLFDRGLSTEHYGFYSYFDKSIFLRFPAGGSNTAVLNRDGGAPFHKANARCTWSQTRFLVQIWTKTGGALLSGPRGDGTGQVMPMKGPNGTTSAFVFSRPGSFPWPVTISVDRHGGDAEEKGLYCYGLDGDGNFETNAKTLHKEERGAGGKIINPAPHAFADIELPEYVGGYTGIDGGSGGCSCQWANW